MVRSVCARSLTALTATILAVLLFALGTTAQVRNPAAPDFPNIQLPAPARGGAALSALAAHLPQLAASYGKTTDELASIFLRDHDIWTDTHGRLFYGCEFGPAPVNAPGAENAGAVLEGPFPDDQTFLLHSRPGSTKVIYLDFDGQVTSGTWWNTDFKGGQDIVSAPFDMDGIPSSFNSIERERIQYIWQRVAEDYAPFDVDVTTQDPGLEALRKTSTTDVNYGTRVVISPTNWYSTGAGGVAYVGVFDNVLSFTTDLPCWVFTQQLGPNNEKYLAEAASHEAGHTLGLNHDGLTNPVTGYYQGQGNWAPIMGNSYYKEVAQWSKGEYAYANNTEDDFAVMLNNGISYRADDHGNFISSATPLTGPAISASGVIGTRTDVDMFSFQTGAGTVSFTVNPAPRGPNLDISVVLYNGTGNLVASNDGAGLPATLTATVAAGTYYLRIDGVGSGDPVTTGYSDYDSLGQYQITGTVIANGNQNPVATASASPTTGTSPLAVNFSSAGSSDPDGTIQTYYWDFNDLTSSSLANPSHTYNIVGTYTATLVVTDNGGLSASDTVTLTVTAPNQAPVARASANPASGYAPLAVSFSSALSSDSDGSIASYSWVFGDGTTSTSANPSHTYSLTGTYVAVLTVTDNQGATGTSSVNISAQQDPSKRPDLIVSSLTASISGTSITVKDTTKNQGATQSSSSMTYIYFSNDAALDAGDTLISHSVGALAPRGSSTVSTVFTLPAGALPGTRYVIVMADGGNNVDESSETNNAMTKSITVPGPDLYVSALSAPTSALAGSTITVTDTTKNQGSAPAAASTTMYYLSIDNVWSINNVSGANDILIGSRGVIGTLLNGALLNGTSNTGSAKVTIPLGTLAGTYYIIARGDGGDVVAETLETNNTKTYRIVVK